MTIILNGSPVPFDRQRIDFETVAHLAGKSPEGLSVTWRVRSTNSGGMLTAGQSTDVVDGMVINAMLTGNA